MNLEVCGLRRCFGKTVALNNVSFSVPGGMIFGFVGPNGAGKTTAIEIMAGLDDPDAGDVLFDDISAVQYPERVRNLIGYMPDFLPEASDITVMDYLHFYCHAWGFSPEATDAAIERAKTFARLTGLERKTLSALSKGMKQHVSLARILLHDPQILLMDEPAAGLDPRARTELYDALKRLAQAGKTILVSSHILTELDEICDGLIIIEKGEIKSCGLMGDLAAKPQADTNVRAILTFVHGEEATANLPILQSLPAVLTAGQLSRRDLFFETATDETLRGVLVELLNRAIPFAAMRRPQMLPDIETLFMQNTSGEVQ